MAEFRRYSSRRSAGNPWITWAIIAVVVLALVWGTWKLFNRPSSTATNNDEPGITLVNDALNTNNSTNSNFNANSNLNSNANTNSAVSTTGGWSGFDVTESCAQPISKATTTRKVMTLNFNVVADNDNLVKVLQQLKDAKVTANFFASGKFAESTPAALEKITAAGFPIYSRGYDVRVKYSDVAAAEVTEQITNGEAALTEATGTSPKPILQPPQGAFDADAVTAGHEAGYCFVLWTVDAFDSLDSTTAAQATERVLSKATPGGIVLLQAGYDLTPTFLPNLLTELKTQGYTFVSLKDLLTSSS